MFCFWRTRRFLAHVYTAEAYIRLRRFSDAMQHLSPQNVGDLSNKSAATSGTVAKLLKRCSARLCIKNSLTREHMAPHTRQPWAFLYLIR